MEKVITLEEALKRIEELENENAKLREELEYYKNRKLSGRQKHNAKWMAIYNDFVACYEINSNSLPVLSIILEKITKRKIFQHLGYTESA